MGLRDRAMQVLAGQLGRPRGPVGVVVGARLNRRNGPSIRAAVDALAPARGSTVADVGFGGGLGLALLLDRVGPDGVVHGVDVSTVSVNAARRRHRKALDAGRLMLHEGPLEELPLASGRIEGIITLNTFYFVTDLEPALTQLRRVLAPAGLLVVGIGDPEAMARLPFTRYGFRLRPVDEIVAAAGAAGLRLVEDRRVRDHPTSPHLLVFAPGA